MVDITKVSGLTDLNSSTGTKAQTGTTTTATAGTTATDAANASTLKSQFLTILMTQLQNQNPLDPMDTKDFTGQLAQFSALEQQIDTNGKLDNMITALNSTASTSAFNYIGQTAELNSVNSIVSSDSKVNWNYTIPSQADTVTVKVKDASGKVLYTKDDTNVASGTYSFTAAQSDLSSTVTPGQVLTFEVVAKNSSGTTLTTNVATNVTVDGVESGADGIDLRAGGLLFSLDDVLRFKTVKAATTTPATTTSTTTDSTTSAAA